MRPPLMFAAASSALVALLSPLTLRVASAQPCPNYLPPEAAGFVTEPAIREASGLAASRRSPGIFWTHNDSGDGPRLFAITDEGNLVGTFTLIDTRASDWEDIAVGPCGDNESCIYVGDVGNNSKQRDDQVIYRVREPSLDPSAPQPVVETLDGVEAMEISYPYDEGIEDDNPDVEALLVHPSREGELYLVTKEGARARLLRATWQADPVEFEHLGTFDAGLVTAGDWHPDGERFAIRTYANIYTFELDGMEPGDAFASASLTERIRGEIQGEAIAYGEDGAALWTLAEGQNQALWRYDCESSEVLEPEPDMAGPPAADMDLPDDMGRPDGMGEDQRSDASPLDMNRSPDAGMDGNNSGSSGCSCGTLRAPSPLTPTLFCGVLFLLLGMRENKRTRLIQKHRSHS